jgi:hypothetical protein
MYAVALVLDGHLVIWSDARGTRATHNSKQVYQIALHCRLVSFEKAADIVGPDVESGTLRHELLLHFVVGALVGLDGHNSAIF